MAYSARSLSTNLLQQAILQAHNFIVGDILAFNGTNYYLAKADDKFDAETVGMVSYVSDSTHFFLTQAGYISNLTGPFTPGNLYYLDPVNGGDLTAIAPSTPGQYVVPLFIADSASSGYYFNNAGSEVVSSPSGFQWNVATTDTPMVINNGYIVNAGGLINLTLPASASPGDIVEVAGYSGSGWQIRQGAGQIIHFGVDNTTSGNTGGLSSNNQYDSVQLINVITNDEWLVLTSSGNINLI